MITEFTNYPKDRNPQIPLPKRGGFLSVQASQYNYCSNPTLLVPVELWYIAATPIAVF